jgi:hypothetical protein
MVFQLMAVELGLGIAFPYLAVFPDSVRSGSAKHSNLKIQAGPFIIMSISNPGRL